MAQTDLRPRAVVLLTDVDTSRRDEPGRLYHHDGRPFTTAEYDLLCTCTRAEIDIAVAYMQPVGDWMSERHTMQKALIGLYMSCTEICGVPDARVTVLAKENHQHHGSTT
ncbi:hypothetical protein AAIB46_36795 [Streptomyces sp. 35M1]|uniref:hypothetical protein n=1 Tax=Streptomyces sp. 35M1 TaxID=3142978 RepID=UPI0039905EEF